MKNLNYLTNEKELKKLFGPFVNVGDKQIHLAQKPYISIQSEGPNIGKVSLFITFFGCNLANTCGVELCDASHTFYTKKEMFDNETYADKPDRVTYPNCEKMYESIFEMNPLGEFNNIVITGGEPMLWQIEIAKLLMFLRDRYSNYVTVEVETNGTLPVEEELIDWFRMVHFNINAKIQFHTKFPLISQITGIRESNKDLVSFTEFDHSAWCIKIIYTSKSIEKDLDKLVNTYDITKDKIYIVPEGSTKAMHLLNIKKCVDFAINNGYNFSPRVHLLWEK